MNGQRWRSQPLRHCKWADTFSCPSVRPTHSTVSPLQVTAQLGLMRQLFPLIATLPSAAGRTSALAHVWRVAVTLDLATRRAIRSGDRAVPGAQLKDMLTDSFVMDIVSGDVSGERSCAHADPTARSWPGRCWSPGLHPECMYVMSAVRRCLESTVFGCKLHSLPRVGSSRLTGAPLKDGLTEASVICTQMKSYTASTVSCYCADCRVCSCGGISQVSSLQRGVGGGAAGGGAASPASVCCAAPGLLFRTDDRTTPLTTGGGLQVTLHHAALIRFGCGVMGARAELRQQACVDRVHLQSCF